MQTPVVLPIFSEVDKLRQQVQDLDRYDPLTSIIKERFKMQVALHITSLNVDGETGVATVPEQGSHETEAERYRRLGYQLAITQLFFDLTHANLDGHHVAILYDMLFNGHAENRPPFDGNEDVFQPINKLIEWYNVQKSSSRMHPLFLAAIFHQRFTTEHIFADGNGRIGRFLLNVVLMQHDYLPVVVFPHERNEYYKALNAADRDDLVPLARFLAQKELDTLADFMQSPEYLSVQGKYELEMQLKQLNGNEKCIVLTEDSNTSSLLSYVLKASGFKMSETNIISYEGCSKLSSANLFAIFVKEKMPHVKIVVHRDRDYLTPDEIEDLANQFRRIDVHFFITKGTDIESHFLNPKHVKACHPGLSDQDAVRLVDQCLHETRSKSVDMLRKKEFGGGNVIRHTHLNQALENLVDQHLFRFTHGKTALRLLQTKLQNQLGEKSQIEKSSPYLSDPLLSKIAMRIWRDKK